VNVVTLLFIIVPGFIADSARRALYGERKVSDFQRTIHSLIFSAFGLGAYLAIGAAVRAWVAAPWLHRAFSPPYVSAVFDPATSNPVSADRWLLLALLLHSVFASLIALIVMKAMRSRWMTTWLQNRAGRSLDPAWSMLWDRHYSTPDAGERWLTVMSGGERILGRFVAASDPSEAQDLILGDPLFWDPDRKQWHADGVRVVFIPQSKIDAIFLSPASGELAPRGYLDSQFRLIPKGSHNEQ
jgi:hypothetical protein